MECSISTIPFPPPSFYCPVLSGFVWFFQPSFD
nr:MAG TPA: hypothetical protein [Caudoviricetes sp.]